MEIKKVGVVGCGVMGQGIVEVSARGGYDVVVTDQSQEFIDKGLGLIESSLARGVQKDRFTQEEMDTALGRIRGTMSAEDFRDCDVLIECISEVMEEKKKVFTTYDEICKPTTIMATNTSSLPIIELAVSTKRPDKFIGTHFFVPATRLKLVEVVVSIVTSEETVSTAMAFCESIGKTPVRAKDTPGYIVNRLHIPYFLAAIRLLEAGTASAEDIDKAVELGLNYPMGPLRLQDLAGLDIVYHSAEVLYDLTKDSVFACPTLLRNLVAAGHLGRKTGKGFYDYPIGDEGT